VEHRERTIPRGVGILGVCTAPGIAHRTEVRSLDRLIPSRALLVEPFRAGFHSRVFPTLQALLAGGIVCLGPRTLSAVWPATAWAAKRHPDTAYAVSPAAAWEWDDVGLVRATPILAHLVPGGVVGIVVEDTLGHPRGAQVACGGIVRDAVLSTQRHKALRFGLNWVVLGSAVPIPLRPDRDSCLPVLWRLSRQKGQDGSQTRPQAAAARARRRAQANPDRTSWRVGDAADVTAATLHGRPKDLQVIGPLPGKAAPYERPAPPVAGQKGRPRKEGDRWPTPRARIEDVTTSPAELQTVAFPQTTRDLRLQVLRDVLWYRGCQTEPSRWWCCWCATRWASGGMRRRSPPTRGSRPNSSSREIAGAGVWNGRPSTASRTSAFTIRGSGASGVWSGRTRWRGSSGR
jgi:hypothetical protein